MTHPDSKFEPFSLKLSNNATITGIKHIPPPSANPPPFRPLMVGIHGGTCTAHNFDVDSKHTASLASSALEIPFVAFNRLNYKDSSSFLPVPEDTTYRQLEGKWNHGFVFPALWEAFGISNGCTGLVAICHSMAVPGSIVAAALYAQDPAPKYPLAGLIMSGWGTTRHLRAGVNPPPETPSPGPQIRFPPEIKQVLMLSEPEFDCYDPGVVKQLAVQDTYMLLGEVVDLNAYWFKYWRQYSDAVKVPIFYAMGEHDWLWVATKETVQEFVDCFPNSERVDGNLVGGAPHALEWWWGSRGWYARCFGWGSEVCAGLAFRNK